MEKQFCFNYEHYAALAGLSDADRRLVAEVFLENKKNLTTFPFGKIP